MNLLKTVLLLTLSLSSFSFSKSDWKLYSPPESSYDVENLVVCGDSFFGISNKSIVSSTDGNIWNYLLTEDRYFSDIYSDGEQLIAIKNDGEALVSVDYGETFFPSGKLSSFGRSFVFKDMRFAISDSGVFVFDSNDSDYVEVGKPDKLVMPAATKSIFTLSHSGHDDRLLYTSNGYDWKSATLPIAGIINCTDSLFILSPRLVSSIRDLYISRNAVDWINVRDSVPYSALAGLRTLTKLKDGYYLGFTRTGNKVTSKDGLSWVSQSFTNDWLTLRSLAATENLIIQKASLDSYYSTDNGETFEPYNLSNMRDVYSINSIGEIGFIGTKYEGLTSSSNGGSSWIQVKNDTNYVPGHDIALGDGKYVTIGSKGKWAHSTDAVNWEIEKEDYLSENSYGSSVSWSGDYFTWIGDLYYPLKYNGELWIPCTTDQLIPISCHVWGNGTMVGVGRSNLIYVGEDVENLDIVELPDNIESLKAVHHNGEFFIAVGDGGVIVKSQDGRDWTMCDNVPVSRCLNGIYWTGSDWYAIGDNSAVLFSEDGDNWRRSGFDVEDNLTTIGVYDSKLYIGGRQLYFKELNNIPVQSIKTEMKKTAPVKVSFVKNQIGVKADYNGKLKMRLFDLKGREIFRSKERGVVDGNVVFPLTNLSHASNLYIIDICGNNFSYRKRVIQFR